MTCIACAGSGLATSGAPCAACLPRRIVSIDPGSARVGAASLHARGSTVARVAVATLAVDEANLAATMADIEAVIAGDASTPSADAVVVEWSDHAYTPRPPKIDSGMPQWQIDKMQKAYAAKVAAINHTRETQARMVERIKVFCARPYWWKRITAPDGSVILERVELPAIPFHKINVIAARAKIGTARRPPPAVDERGRPDYAANRASTDRLVREAVMRHLGDAPITSSVGDAPPMSRLQGPDQCDAVAAGIGWLLAQGQAKAPRVRCPAEGRAPRGSREPKGPAAGLDRIVEAVAELTRNGAPTRQGAIARAMGCRKPSDYACNVVLRQAVDLGLVVRVERGVYAMPGWTGDVRAGKMTHAERTAAYRIRKGLSTPRLPCAGCGGKVEVRQGKRRTMCDSCRGQSSGISSPPSQASP